MRICWSIVGTDNLYFIPNDNNLWLVTFIAARAIAIGFLSGVEIIQWTASENCRGIVFEIYLGISSVTTLEMCASISMKFLWPYFGHFQRFSLQLSIEKLFGNSIFKILIVLKITIHFAIRFSISSKISLNFQKKNCLGNIGNNAKGTLEEMA